MRPDALVSAAGPVRVAVLGCADVAARRMLPALTGGGAATVTAIGSRDPARAADLAGRFGVPFAGTYAEALDRPDVDAVYLPLPPALRGEWVRRALRAGKHVLAEKPLTTGAEHTAALLAEARARGLALVENMAFLHHRGHRTVYDRLASGDIGDLRHVTATFTIPPRPPGDLRNSRELGGGALLDAGVYPLRTAMRLLGPGLRVAGAALRLNDDGVDVAGSALLVGPRGVTAALTFGMAHAYRASYELHGSSGRMVLDRPYSAPVDHRPLLRMERDGRTEEVPLAADDQFARMGEEFARMVADPAAREPAAAESLVQAELVDEVARRALRTQP
ncbi:Gfo/Idh/MocA family oxidoreductase [Micromonospora tulbaghiae]|uniref:Gfo/Idh/MocA family protein n=1 Tax=Micromonospora tulbaghiae TaxID=479978 RepID=UPI0034039BEB